MGVSVHGVSLGSVVTEGRTYTNSVKDVVYMKEIRGKENIPSVCWVGIISVQAAITHLQWPWSFHTFVTSLAVRPYSCAVLV